MGSGTNRKARLEAGSRGARRAGTKSGSTRRTKPKAYLKRRAFRKMLLDKLRGRS